MFGSRDNGGERKTREEERETRSGKIGKIKEDERWGKKVKESMKDGEESSQTESWEKKKKETEGGKGVLNRLSR